MSSQFVARCAASAREFTRPTSRIGWRGAGMTGAFLCSVILTAGTTGLSQTWNQTPGTVVAWGGDVLPYVAPGTRFTAIAAGDCLSVALKSDGTVVAWGGDAGGCTMPTGLSGVVAVAAGWAHTLALKGDGTVVAWGWNAYGQSTVPTGLRGVVAVAAGGYHSLALKSDGTVVAWGYNGNGECNVPSGLSGVVAVAAGEFHSLALKSDGTVVAWGDNFWGQSTVPAGLGGVVALAAGWCHNLALMSDGTVVAWGDNGYGQSTVPARLGGVVAVAAGWAHSLALKSDGTVVAWGAGEPGQSGDPSHGQSTVPAGLTRVVAIAAGTYDSLAIVASGPPSTGSGPAVLHGLVTDTDGAALAVATVSAVASAAALAQPAAQAITDSTGSYQMPSLGPGAYVLRAWDGTHQTSTRALNFNASTAEQDFRLAPMPGATQAQPTARQPDLSYNNLGPMDSALLVFDEAQRQFVTIVPGQNEPPLDRMTIVLTHGWISSASAWPRQMAILMRGKVTAAMANILAWDWPTAASGAIPEERTPDQGLALGRALWYTLGAAYNQKLHFIGHSLGALVNAAAANYLHGDATGQQEVAPAPWLASNTHVTLLDEAEDAALLESLLGGQTVIFDGISASIEYSSLATGFGETTLGWKAPLPVRKGWADNYMSLVGSYQAGAVNVYLVKAPPPDDPMDAHSYAWWWYTNTVVDPGDCILGFQRSDEARATGLSLDAFPPPEAEFPQGASYEQDPLFSDMLALAPLSTVGSWSSRIGPFFVVRGTVDAVQTEGSVATEVAQGAQSAQQAVSSAFNYVENQAQQGYNALVGLADSAVLGLTLTTPSSGPGPHPLDATPPPMAWVPLAIPANASAMAFDFAVTNNPCEDALVCGIGTNSLFTLQMKFVPTNGVSSSPLIDITPWAGTTSEVFFGFLGGTSSNCAVRVENIRFYDLAPPRLGVQAANGSLVLSWPSAAVGYVLEATPSLAPANWQALTSFPSILGASYVITNQVGGQSMFYRLRPQ